LQLQPLGKFAVTVVEMKSQEGVRISFRAEFLEDFLQWPPVADKAHPQPGYHPRPGEVSMRIQEILERPLSELFSLQRFVGYNVSAPMDWTHLRCTGCGERVIGRYTHHLGQEAWCPACWDHRVHGPGPDEGR
jgi:formylmethanofuran dehydrogenase subunit E